MWTKDGECFDRATEDDCEIALSYIVCTKFGHEKWDWETFGGTDADVMVDFASADWEERLEEDMLLALEGCANKYGLSYTEPNK